MTSHLGSIERMPLASNGSAHAFAGNTPLADFVAAHPRLFVLTGAGCSTDSGIPDYRDANGEWKRTPPVTYQAFVSNEATRQRYWARNLVGWRRFGSALPNATHRALAKLEQQNRVAMLLTQNVDRLHQAAGTQNVIDLHGRMDIIRCLSCELRLPRGDFQAKLLRLNPSWADAEALDAPDGDADLQEQDFSSFVIPVCADCGGMLKPDVVFFGENVPRERVDAAMQAMREADAVLVVGSSLMVYSGYRFVQAAVAASKPVAAVNLGHTRADSLLTLKVNQSCAQALSFL